MIGLKFLLRDGHFFIALITPELARDIQHKWSSGKYAVEGPARIGEMKPDGTGWWIDVSAIMGMHTVTMQELLGQQQGHPAQPVNMVSGVNVPLQNWKP